MGQKGKIAVLSSQNSFKASTPYLFKTGRGCPVDEDEVFATMNTSAVAMSAWRRFYEYYAHPGPSAATETRYCTNFVRNGVMESQRLGVPFVASATNADRPGGRPRPPSPHHILTGPAALAAIGTHGNSTQWVVKLASNNTSEPLVTIETTLPLGAAASPNMSRLVAMQCATMGSDAVGVRVGIEHVNPNCTASPTAPAPWLWKLAPTATRGVVQIVSARSGFCLTIPPHKSARLQVCGAADTVAAEGQLFQHALPAADSLPSPFVLAPGMFRAGERIGVVGFGREGQDGGDEGEGGALHASAVEVTIDFAFAMFMVSRETSPSGPGFVPGGAPNADRRSHFEWNNERWSKWPRWADADTSWDQVRPRRRPMYICIKKLP